MPENFTSMNMDATYTPKDNEGRGNVKQRALRKISGQSGANITVYCAVSTRGGLLHCRSLQRAKKKLFPKVFASCMWYYYPR